jgi:hypothetical protein
MDTLPRGKRGKNPRVSAVKTEQKKEYKDCALPKRRRANAWRLLCFLPVLCYNIGSELSGDAMKSLRLQRGFVDTSNWRDDDDDEEESAEVQRPMPSVWEFEYAPFALLALMVGLLSFLPLLAEWKADAFSIVIVSAITVFVTAAFYISFFRMVRRHIARN